MIRFFRHATTLSAQLMLCAVLACAALWSQSLPLDADRAGMLTQSDPQQVAVSPPEGPVLNALQDTAPLVPASALGTTTADLASDLPELLLVKPQLVDETAAFARLARPLLRALPHPFLERPQRPPRHQTVLA